MPNLTNRLKLALPNGNEYVNRASLIKIFEDIDKLVTILGDFNIAKQEIDDNLAKKVSKSGDTMTGNLTLDGSTGERALSFKVGAGASDLIAMRNVLATNTFSLRDYRLGMDIWSWKDNTFTLHATNTNLLKKTGDTMTDKLWFSGASKGIAWQENSREVADLIYNGRNIFLRGKPLDGTVYNAVTYDIDKNYFNVQSETNLVKKSGDTMNGNFHVEVNDAPDKRIAWVNKDNLLWGFTTNADKSFQMYDWKNKKSVWAYDGNLFDMKAETNLLKKTDTYYDFVQPSGTTKSLASNPDLNQLTKTGFYGGTNLLNAPVSNIYFYVEVIGYSDAKYALQRATSLTGANGDPRATWIRRMENNVWGAWERLIDSKGGTITGDIICEKPNGANTLVAFGTGEAGKRNYIYGGKDVLGAYSDEAGQLIWRYTPSTKTFDLNATNTNLLRKTGDTMTGPLVFDVNTEEKVIRGNDSTGPLAGFFFQKNRIGAYDWKNKLPIFGYEAATKTFEVRTPSFKFEERKVLTTSDLEDGIPSRSGKDVNGIYTIYEEANKNGKFSKKSILSSPDADGNYLIRTVTYYEDGKAYNTEIFDLKYDEDGDFVKAVPR